jgi:hypothetical protein
LLQRLPTTTSARIATAASPADRSPCKSFGLHRYAPPLPRILTIPGRKMIVVHQAAQWRRMCTSTRWPHIKQFLIFFSLRLCRTVGASFYSAERVGYRVTP